MNQDKNILNRFIEQACTENVRMYDQGVVERVLE